MATESFGVSFGNPSKYIGSNPGIARAAQALKIGGSIYLMDKSGFTGFLDNLGIKQKNGEYTFDNSAPAASVSPVAASTPAPVPEGSAAPPVAMAPVAVPPAPAVVPPTPQRPLGSPDFPGSPVGPLFSKDRDFAPATSGVTEPQAEPVPTPRIQGVDILTGKQISVANPNDFDPRENYGYTTQLASGSEFSQQPGYMKPRKTMSNLFGGAQA
jgi:hypothetical protein